VAARRGGFDRVEAYGAGVGPAEPVLRFAVPVVRRRAVIAVVTMIEGASYAPTAHCARSSRYSDCHSSLSSSTLPKQPPRFTPLPRSTRST